MSDTEEYEGTGNDELDDLVASYDEARAELEEDDVELDLSEAGGFEPFEGKHPSTITKIEVVKAKTTGTPMLKCEVTIIDGDYKGRKVWPNFMLKGGGAWKTKDLITATGQDIDLAPAEGNVQLGKVSRFKGIPFIGTYKVKVQPGYKDATELASVEALEVDVPDDLR